ncbi:hypothetical protein M5E88_02595 [Akkermansia muciniphila]|nr:hypothetical protein M5E88_02595 [Akkermansia muciniphila]
MFFVVDEAKTVPDEIFDAIERCTLQFCIYLSSPGKPEGQFYRCFHEEKDLFCPMVVTAFDCPHISQERIDRILARVGVMRMIPISVPSCWRNSRWKEICTSLTLENWNGVSGSPTSRAGAPRGLPGHCRGRG